MRWLVIPKSTRLQLIVNAAAYIAVDRAEEEHDLASRINADAPGVLAEVVEALGALLVHYSTDYVFDGSGDAPWQEADTPGPVNHYGASKLAGERRIQDSGCRHLIFRTSWVYAARGSNFLATMARLMRERDALQVIDDQVGAPTGAELIADVTAHAIRQTLSDSSKQGLYNLAAGGETSWLGHARHASAQLPARYQQAGKRLRSNHASLAARGKPSTCRTQVFPRRKQTMT